MADSDYTEKPATVERAGTIIHVELSSSSGECLAASVTLPPVGLPSVRFSVGRVNTFAPAQLVVKVYGYLTAE
jgi:hypothetical protein